MCEKCLSPGDKQFVRPPAVCEKCLSPGDKQKCDRLTDIALYIYTRISGPYGPFEILAPAEGLEASLK